MSPNQKQTFTPPANPSPPGTAVWLYDEIMRHIEPDLLSTMLDTHIEMYKDETQDERLERMKAYDAAFALFDSVASAFAKDFDDEVRSIEKQARAKALQKKEKKDTGTTVEDIESKLDQA